MGAAGTLSAAHSQRVGRHPQGMTCFAVPSCLAGGGLRVRGLRHESNLGHANSAALKTPYLAGAFGALSELIGVTFVVVYRSRLTEAKRAPAPKVASALNLVR